MGFHLDEIDQVVDLRPTFRVSRVAFFLLAFGIGLLTLTPLCQAIYYITFSPPLRQALMSPAWNWGMFAPARLACFVGSLLLVNRWRERDWLTRSLFLFVMQGYLFGVWFADHAGVFIPGVAPKPGHFSEWSQFLAAILALASIFLMAWLAWDVCRRFNSPESESLYRAVRGAAVAGLGLWAFYLLKRIDWNQPWPLQMRFFDRSTLDIMIGALLARSVAGMLTMILCGHACSVCSQELAKAEKQIRDEDPFAPRPGGF